MPSRQGPRLLLVNLLLSLRPRQWTKNLFVFAALVFAQRLTDGTAVARAGAAFVIFCVLSGVVYLINDVFDREQDQRHPLKKNRPIASGALNPNIALASAVALGALALMASFALGTWFFAAAAAYLVLLATYS